jgi:hypothetical protein
MVTQKSASAEDVTKAAVKTFMMAATADDNLLQRMLDLQSTQSGEKDDRDRARSKSKAVSLERAKNRQASSSGSRGRRAQSAGRQHSSGRKRAGTGSGAGRLRGRSGIQDGGQSESDEDDAASYYGFSTTQSSSLSSESEEDTFRKRGKKKSGIGNRSGAGRTVKKPQRWAQSGLLEEYSAESVSFSDLDLAMFTAGELGVALSVDTSKIERASRLNLLKELCYLATKKPMSFIRKVYASILNKIELCQLRWGDDVHPQIQWMLAMEQEVVVSKKADRKDMGGGRSKGSRGGANNFWCLAFNKGNCNQPENHEVFHKGSMIKAGHFCARCFDKEKRKVPHSEISETCPHKQ